MYRPLDLRVVDDTDSPLLSDPSHLPPSSSGNSSVYTRGPIDDDDEAVEYSSHSRGLSHWPIDDDDDAAEYSSSVDDIADDADDFVEDDDVNNVSVSRFGVNLMLIFDKVFDRFCLISLFKL